jgi:uncharacterized Zn-binding protein involved in type VI secretion
MPALALCDVDFISTGHACDTTAKIQGNLQSKVSVNGKFVAVLGDSIFPHDILINSSCLPHNAFITGGSSKVFINGIPVSRVGDSADQGAIISGSASITVGS